MALGPMVNSKVNVNFLFKKVTFMKVMFPRVKKMVMVYINIIIKKFMKENSKMI